MLEEGSGKRGLIRVGLMVEVNGSGEYAQGGPPLIGPSPMAGRVVRVRVRINVMRRARWGEEGMMMMAPKKNAEKSVNVQRATCNGLVANGGQLATVWWQMTVNGWRVCHGPRMHVCVCVCFVTVFTQVHKA